MKILQIISGLVLIGCSAFAQADGYNCPAGGGTSGGWTPPECSQAVAPVVCPDCGTVESVNVVETGASGVGAVAGAVAGGVIGNKIGGRHKTLSTIIGAVGGGVAGHYGEKAIRGGKRWDVVVLMDDGSKRSLSFDAEPGYQAGDKVHVSGNTLTRQ